MFKIRILYFYLITLYRRSRFKNREELIQWQERKIFAFLAWAKTHSKFYQKRLADLELKNWRQMPVIDKKVMMENFSDLNTVNIDRDQAFEVALASEKSRNFTPTLNDITVGLSSGTSGSRGLFLVSHLERARHAGTILAKVLPNSLLSRNKVAFFMRANSNLYTASQSSRLVFEFFDLLTSIEDHFERLHNFSPTLLFAPPSMLIHLAEAQRSGRIAIRPLRIFSIAETLDPLDQKHIETAFGQKVHQIYQCTEGFLGATCSEGTLHLNEDCVHIEPEWLDETQTKFMPIITDFSRTSQPILRYRLNDILTIQKTPCPCGSPMMAIEAIEGRADDMIYFEGKNNEPVAVFPDFIRRAVISASGELDEYLVRQYQPGSLVISIRSKNSAHTLTQEITTEMNALAEKLKANPPSLEWSNEFPHLEGKKLRRVVRINKPN